MISRIVYNYISGHSIIGSYFINGRVITVLETISLRNALRAHHVLNLKYPGRWIGQFWHYATRLFSFGSSQGECLLKLFNNTRGHAASSCINSADNTGIIWRLEFCIMPVVNTSNMTCKYFISGSITNVHISMKNKIFMYKTYFKSVLTSKSEIWVEFRLQKWKYYEG